MKLLRILLLAISLTTTLFARAYDFEANGLYFNFVSTGDLTCALTEGPSPYAGALVIPDVVEYSGKQLKVIRVDCKLPQVSSVQLGKNITKLCAYCFDSNKLISSITIPTSVKEIGSGAFYDCTSLTSVTWEGDMILSDYIFCGCSKLKNLSYKSICKNIPRGAFQECTSLSIDLSKVESIDANAFRGCTSLKVIDLTSIKKLGTGAGIYTEGTFYECGNISLLVIGPDISKINTGATVGPFDGCIVDSLAILPCETPLYLTPYFLSNFFINTVIKSLYLGRDTYTARSEYSLQPFSKTDLRFVRVGGSVTRLPIGWTKESSSNGYFKDCENLTEIIFEGDNIEIGNNCFTETNLKNISLPIGTNKLGANIFPSGIECISFGSEIVFDKTFINIKDESTLKKISFLSSSAPKYNGTFGNSIYTSTKLLIPYGSKEAYQNAEPWRNFWNIEEMPGVATERVEITPTNTKIQVGDSLHLTGTRYPENSVDPIQWKSSDIKIATVSDAGLVKAVAPGKVTITATSGKAVATCEVTVSPVAAQKIVLSKDKVSINESDTAKIIATVQPENTTDKTVTWSSSDEKIATVSTDGIIKAVKVGTATITAACGDVKATCEVTVLPIAAEKIVLSKEKMSINELDSIKITATVTPENTTYKTITWSSSDEKIATVSNDGIIKAIKVGTATITATCGEVKATCEVTVLPITAEKIVLDLTEVSLNQSDTIKITATITPENTTDKTIMWSSSDEKVATVSTDGIITAVGVGKATITASCGEIKATCEVTVLEPNIGTDFADNKLTITVEGSGKPVEISIYSVMGQCVFHKTVEAAVTVKDEIDLSSLSAGTYIVQIISGEMNTSKRIVK
ncbi:MAG: Ig-like domain-containing protein [Muribaculaceae bacterium]|nr:Ig-like domain-containing protein [Muribaculaceae bacterium]